MAKRFTDTNKWDDPWFLSLSPENKLFYGYILDRCDHAGVWRVNFKLANYLIGKNLKKDKVLQDFDGRIIAISDDYWLIKKFISFQYGELNKKNNAHRGVIGILNKFNILDPEKLAPSEGLTSPLEGAQDKDKDMDKDKEKEKEKTHEFLSDDLFNVLWDEYGHKVSKVTAKKSAMNKIKNQNMYDLILSAIKKYKKHLEVSGQYQKHFSTWINQECWNDEYDVVNEDDVEAAFERLINNVPV